MKILGSFSVVAILIPSALATISIGHGAINNYAWSSGSEPCPGVTISAYDSGSPDSLCGINFNLGMSTYRLSHCGEASFQLQERAGGDGWVFDSSCVPPDGGDLSIKCGGERSSGLWWRSGNAGEDRGRGKTPTETVFKGGCSLVSRL